MSSQPPDHAYHDASRRDDFTDPRFEAAPLVPSHDRTFYPFAIRTLANFGLDLRVRTRYTRSSWVNGRWGVHACTRELRVQASGRIVQFARSHPW